MTTSSIPKRNIAVEAQVAACAAQQHGAISRRQALDLGMSDSTIQRRVADGRWRRKQAGVYTMRSNPGSWMQEVWSAYLAVGPTGVVSHESALHLHGLHQVSRRPVTLTVPHGGHARLDGVLVHQIDDLVQHPRRLATMAGLPITTPERALVDVSATVTETHLSHLIDKAVAEHGISLARLAASLVEVLRPGKPGVTKLARLLDALGDGYVPPQSELERALFVALELGGLPEPRRQVPLPGRGALHGLVDAAYPDAKLIVEADGRRWHARIEALRRDRRRDREAARAGWQTVRFVYEEIVYEPAEVANETTEILASRGFPLLSRAS